MKINENMAATMKKIDANGIKAGEEVTNDFYRAVNALEDTANTRLNFYEISRRSEITKVVDDIRKAGISEFTLSEKSTALMEIISALYQNGCTLSGPIDVFDQFSIDDETPETITALLFKA